MDDECEWYGDKLGRLPGWSVAGVEDSTVDEAICKGQISIANPQPRIREILEQSHIVELLPIEPSDSAAVHHNGSFNNG